MIWGSEKGTMTFGESLALKAVSLLLALILWITILGFKQEELKLNVKLEPILAPNMMITNKIPPSIQFTLSGPRVLLKDVEKKVLPIRPDLRRSSETTLGFSVSDELLGELPRGVRVTSFFPPNILIRLEEVVERYISVEPRLGGQPAEGYEVSQVVCQPSKVAVSGPRGPLRLLESVSTEAFDIEGLTGSKEGVVPVEVDSGQGFRLSRQRTVRVTVTAKKVNGSQ